LKRDQQNVKRLDVSKTSSHQLKELFARGNGLSEEITTQVKAMASAFWNWHFANIEVSKAAILLPHHFKHRRQSFPLRFVQHLLVILV